MGDSEGQKNPAAVESPSERPVRKRRRALRVLGALAGAVALAVGALGAHLYLGSRTMRAMLPGHIVSTAINTLRGRPLDDWTPDKQFPGRTALNVLILGCDYDYDNHGRVVKAGARSDSILVARFDFANKRISALTIPRDTAVYIPGYTGFHKVNAAHAYGGPQLAEKTIQSSFGIPCDAYVDLDFHGFVQLVDALGGIDVNVKKPLDYDDNWGHLHIHLKPGYQHLNGYQAMGYVRFRHSDSDYMRSERQHEFLQALRVKLADPANILRIPRAMDTLHDSIQHDITDDQMLALVNFARSAPAQNVEVATIPSTEGPSYVTVDAEKSAQLIARMFFPEQMVALNVDTPNPYGAPSETGYSRATRHSYHGRRHGHSHRRSARSTRDSTRDTDNESAGPADDGEPTPPSTPQPDPGGPGGGGGLVPDGP